MFRERDDVRFSIIIVLGPRVVPRFEIGTKTEVQLIALAPALRGEGGVRGCSLVDESFSPGEA